MYGLSGLIAAFAPSLLPSLPYFPLALPPATPLPLKSASSVAFAERSIFGSSTGTFTGASRTLNPFGGAASSFGAGGNGGGLCSVTFFTFGGGGGSFFLTSGGGGSFFISTNLTFASRFSLSFATPARAV